MICLILSSDQERKYMGVSVAHATPISEKLIFIYTNMISYKK